MTKKKKVLVISYYFPPMNAIAAKRYGHMCKYFDNYGYEAYVITAKQNSRDLLNVKSDLPVPIDEDRIIRIGIVGRVYPFVHSGWLLLARYLRKKGVTFSNTVDTSAIGWAEKVIEDLDLSRLQDIDIVIGTYPRIGNILVGKYIARKLKIPFIADVRDLISDYEDVAAPIKRAERMEKVLERLIFGNVSAIVAVTKGFSNIFRKRYPWIKTRTIYNGWDRKNMQALSGEADAKYIYYAGSLYYYRLESFQLLFDALSDNGINDVEVWIRSVGPENLDKLLDKMIVDSGLESVVKRLPAVSEDIVIKERECAYINLIPSTIHEDDLAVMTTLPGKTFELLVNKPPILAIAPEKAEISEILALTKKGIATIDTDRIAEFIIHLNKNYTGNEVIEEFSRKNQARRLCAFMDEILEEKC